MSTINKVLIGFASMVCTAMTFSAAVSPALPAAQEQHARMMQAGVTQAARVQIMAGLQQPASDLATIAVSQGRQRAAPCGASDTGVRQGRIFTLVD